MTLIASNRRPEDAVYRHVIPAGEPWLFEVQKGQTLRLLDLEGNQAIDTLFYNADNPRERYDPQRTLRRQGNAYLTTGSQSGQSAADHRCRHLRSPRYPRRRLCPGEQHRALRPG